MERSHRKDILFFFALAVALYVAFIARQVLLLIYVSMIFAIVLTPFVGTIQRVKIRNWQPGRALAILLLLLAVAAALAIFFTFALPPIFNDARALAHEWPERSRALNDKIRSLPYGDRFDMSTLTQYAGRALGGALGIILNVAGGLLGFFSGLILMVYFMIDGERAFRWIMSMFRPDARMRLEATSLRAERKVRNWLIGQAALMLILGILATIVYAAMGLRYAYALGVLTGLANIVPIIGPIISVALACLVAMVDSPVKVLGVLAFYLLYQQLENAYLGPRIMRSSVDLPALAIVISLAVGGELAGILGALMAVPTAAIVSVFIEEYLVKTPAPDPAPAA